MPVYNIPDGKWKELGKHINNIVTMASSEKVIASLVMSDKNKDILTVTKNGMIKKSKMEDYEVTRFSKTIAAIKLKEDDEVVSVMEAQKNILMTSKNGYYCLFENDEVPLTGIKASGVKGINLKEDEVVSGISYEESAYLNVFTNQNTAKRVKISDLEKTGRAKRGNMLIKKVKSVNYQIMNAIASESKDTILIKCDSEIKEIKNSDIAIMDLASTGSLMTKNKIDTINKKSDFISFLKKENLEQRDEPKENKVKELTIDDFLDDFKL